MRGTYRRVDDNLASASSVDAKMGAHKVLPTLKISLQVLITHAVNPVDLLATNSISESVLITARLHKELHRLASCDLLVLDPGGGNICVLSGTCMYDNSALARFGRAGDCDFVVIVNVEVDGSTSLLASIERLEGGELCAERNIQVGLLSKYGSGGVAVAQVVYITMKTKLARNRFEVAEQIGRAS